jgi:hypothetical protein
VGPRSACATISPNVDQLNQAFQQATFQGIGRPAGWVLLQQRLQSGGDAAAGWASPRVQVVPQACRISTRLKYAAVLERRLSHGQQVHASMHKLQQHQVKGRMGCVQAASPAERQAAAASATSRRPASLNAWMLPPLPAHDSASGSCCC